MELTFNRQLLEQYHSGTQIARVLTEDWMSRNMFCPRCGHERLAHFEANRPVADFYCPHCHSEYELKSKNGCIGKKVNDGAYETMIARITGNNNPDFFFTGYSKEEWQVNNLLFVPRHFFVPEIIEKRKPLAETARRAGWVGCNILIDQIPDQGRIAIIEDGNEVDPSAVVEKVMRSSQLAVKNIQSRSWLMDILHCVNRIPSQQFTLADMYDFADELALKYPQNHNIKPKIRQQLQFLRDKGIIAFLGSGHYQKLV